MIKRLIICLSACFILAGCATGPEGYFKRSANNKLFDSKGLKGGKRAPLYNKKYIVKAKKNVVSEDYEDDDDIAYDQDSEDENISLANREMYRDMIREDRDREERKRRKWSIFDERTSDKRYPPISHASRSLSPDEYSMDDVHDELQEIKEMLYEAEQDLASYKCPTAAELEKSHKKKAIIKPQTAPKKPKIEPLEKVSPQQSTDIIEPVQSI